MRAMIDGMGIVIDLLERPVYTFAQVDELLGVGASTARRWIDGYTRQGRTYTPVIRERSTGREVATWGEFVECRFLAEYRDAGVSLGRMRPVVERLRAELKTPYPLASASLWLEPQGREVVARVQRDLGDELAPSLLLVRTGEHQLPLNWTEPVERFTDSIRWSVGEGPQQVTAVWADGPGHQVEINPLRSFGEPVVRGVPTSVLAELIRAGDSVVMVAELYDLEEAQVRAALAYEERRAA